MKPAAVAIDLSTPKNAALTYYRAMASGDVEAARASVLGDDLTYRYIDSATAFSAAAHNLYGALADRYGREAARSNPEFLGYLEGFASPDVPRSVAGAEVHVTGDIATVTLKPVGGYAGNEGAPAVFKRVDGKWRLAILASSRLDGLQAQEALTASAANRRRADWLARLERDVIAGRFKNVGDVWAGGEYPPGVVVRNFTPPRPAPTYPTTARIMVADARTLPPEPPVIERIHVGDPVPPHVAPTTSSSEPPPTTSSAPTSAESATPPVAAVSQGDPGNVRVNPVEPPTTQPEPVVIVPADVTPSAPARRTDNELAIRKAHLEVMRGKLDKGVQVNAKDLRGRTMLHDAAIAGEDDSVKLLISKGADIKAIDSQGWTALHWAASGGQTDVARLLLDASADPNARDQFGNTPLHWAAIFDQKDAAILLIERGSDLKAKDARGKTPLQAAAEHDALAVAKVLISKGANLKAKDEDGITPLHAVVIHARAALSDLTLTGADAGPGPGTAIVAAAATGAPVEVSAESRETRDSIIRRSKDMINLLISDGADVNERTPRGQTPLHLAAWDDTRELAALLVSRGADVDAQDSKGHTPLEMAVMRGQQQVAHLLSAKALNR